MSKKKSPIKSLQVALRKDYGYYIGWKCNIAMAFYDEALKQKSRDSHKKIMAISNQAAINFIQMLIKQ